MIINNISRPNIFFTVIYLYKESAREVFTVTCKIIIMYIIQGNDFFSWAATLRHKLLPGETNKEISNN